MFYGPLLRDGAVAFLYAFYLAFANILLSLHHNTSVMTKGISILLLALLLSLHAVLAHAQGEADTVMIETSGNYISIPVTLNGKPKRFILDTGCGAHVVFRHAIDSTEQITMNGDSIESSSGKTQVAEQMLGCLKVSKYDSDEVVPIYVTAVDSLMMLRGDGIVGMQYILEHQHMNMKIDVHNKQVIFTKNKHLFDDEVGQKMRTKLIDNRVAIKLKMSPGIKTKNVVLDSGCDHLFDLDAKDFDRIMSHKHRERFMHQVVGEKASNMGGMYGLDNRPITALKLDKLIIADLRFHDVDVETGNESLLGFPFLQAASIVYYYKGKRIKVLPYTAVRDYRIIRQEEKVKRGGYTIIYNKEKVIESIL